MRNLKWFVLIPILAALLVFAPGLLGPSEASRTDGTPPEGVFRRHSEPAAATPELPSLLGVASSALGVILLAVGGIWLVRRLQSQTGQGAGHEIQVKESRALSPKRRLHLVRVSDRLLVVAESEQGIQLVCDLTPQDEEARITGEEDAPATADSGEGEGATPRDLVLPRPRRRVAPQGKKRAALTNFRELLSQLAEPR